MTILEENVKKYYQSGYNCSETLLHACNETYQLDISEEDMKIMAGFGGGMFIGSTWCISRIDCCSIKNGM